MAECKRLLDVLEDRGENYILPFFWMKSSANDESILREEMEKVYDCGIRAVCIESRPHEGFGTESWFHDMDIILDEARKKSMRVWLLDDRKFPTGCCNNAFVEKYPHLSKLYLAERHMDVLGPAKDNGVLIEPFLGKDGRLLAVLAVEKPDTETLAVNGERVLDLTDRVHEGVVYFDVPEGYWRIFVLFTTRTGGGREAYMNLLDSASVKVLLEEVYEPHYRRYKDDFGKTFAGFFSDEPELGNAPGYGFHETLGKRDVRLPWSGELEERLRALWGEDFVRNLPALWYEYGAKTPAIRGEYMENVTRLVEKNFSRQIGEWCRDRGVEYIGHLIEDDNAHARMGCSLGHYFRAQAGQAMSGIDLVHLQIIPGFTETVHQWIASDRDGEFFHYGLAKLGSSGAHIDPAKKGRALCEIYGSYGWAEGVSLMRWLADHMLVRGINTFVPHAFSPVFPDRDCPPHFYARGNNPQYRFFARFMRYMNRLCHLLSGGKPLMDAGVLYHAEAEWTGKKAMLFQKPVRKLLENQLDCDVLPADVFENAEISAKEFFINGTGYRALILPACERIPDSAAEFAARLGKHGVPVYMLEKLPDACTSGKELPEGFLEAAVLLPLDALVPALRMQSGSLPVLDKTLPLLRFSRYRHADSTVLMFFNEHTQDRAECTVTLPADGADSLLRYDAFENAVCGVPFVQDGRALSWTLSLEPGESAVYIMTQGEKALPLPKILSQSVLLDNGWGVEKASAPEYPHFEKALTLQKGEALPNMNGAGYFPRFSGTFRYTAEFDLPDGALAEGAFRLELPQVGDCAEVFVNGEYAGMAIGRPFCFCLSGLLKARNRISIEVTNTPVWQVHDGQSTHVQLAPTGLLKAPVLFYETSERT